MCNVSAVCAVSAVRDVSVVSAVCDVSAVRSFAVVVCICSLRYGAV